MISRRHFLCTAAAATAAAASWRSEAIARSAQADVLVDWHSHFVSQAEVAYLKKRSTPPRVIVGSDDTTQIDNLTTASFAGGLSPYSPSDITARLRNLDENGVARQLLTHTVALGLDATVPIEDLRPLFRAFNNELAGVVHAHPERFLAVAALPTADPQWAAEELHRAHRDLGFIGGSLPLNAFATLEGAERLKPVFDRAQQLGSHFFIHRAPASSSIPGQPPLYVPKDTDYARWSLISNTHLTAGAITLGLTDFLDPYPDVTVQIIMLGGFLPYLIDTWVEAGKANGLRDPLARLRRLYIDPGPYSRNGPWVRQAADALGADRILFGTDFGVGGGTRGDVGPALASLNAALTRQQKRLIYRENSEKLLRTKGLA